MRSDNVRKRQVVLALDELFREYGYNSTSLSIISGITGLGKGSLYNFFPEGKEQMLAEVLDLMDCWLKEEILPILMEEIEDEIVLNRIFKKISEYYRFGERPCILNTIPSMDLSIANRMRISRTSAMLEQALLRLLIRIGWDSVEAQEWAERVLATIQGGLVMSVVTGDTKFFVRVMSRLEKEMMSNQKRRSSVSHVRA